MMLYTYFATPFFQSVGFGIFENTTLSGKIIRRVKIFVGENFRHLQKISSLFPDEVFPDRVLYRPSFKMKYSGL